MNLGATALLLAVDIVVVAGASILVGALAPRWPARWLQRDVGPLILLPFETPAWYRRIGAPRLARHLPELGDTFGGQSKSALPGGRREHLATYLVEVRRAEWVHWASISVTLLLFLWNPWWLAMVFVVVVAGGNAPFIAVLRNNRVRLRRIIDKDGSSA